MTDLIWLILIIKIAMNLMINHYFYYFYIYNIYIYSYIYYVLYIIKSDILSTYSIMMHNECIIIFDKLYFCQLIINDTIKILCFQKRILKYFHIKTIAFINKMKI